MVEDTQTKKIAVQLLELLVEDEKNIIKTLKNPNTKQFLQSLEKCWTVFMDLYKTLEAFPVHLIKVLIKFFEKFTI